jgi:hypothetical protein
MSAARATASGVHAHRLGGALRFDMKKVGDTLLKEWLERAGADGKALVDAYRK